MAEFYSPDIQEVIGADGRPFRVYRPGLQNPELIGPPADLRPEQFGPPVNMKSAPMVPPIQRAEMEAQRQKDFEMSQAAPAVVPEASVELAQPSMEVQKANESLLNIKPSAPVQSLYDKGISQQKSGILNQAKAEAQQQREIVKIYDANQKEMDRLAAEEAQKRADLNQRMTDRLTSYDQAITAARDAKIDGWANASTGTKVMAGIGIVLGGLGVMASGGENQALKIINNAIDRDIQLQKANAQQKKDYASSIYDSYRMMREQGADDIQATLAAKASALERVKLMIERAAAQSGSDVVQAKAQQMIGALDAQAGQYKDSVALKTMDEFQKTYKPERMTKLGLAPYGSGEDVSKFREKLTDFENADASIGEMISIAQKGGKGFSFTNLKPKAEVLQTTLIGMLRLPLTGPGALTETEREMIKDIIPNPTKLMSLDSATMSKLRALQSTLRRNISNSAQGLGYGQMNFGQTEIIKGVGAFEKVQ